MSNIRMRVWNKKSGQWYKGAAVQMSALQGQAFGLSEVNGNIVELQQYSGLRDKNGVEIYEGDFIGVDGEITVRRAVDFEDGMFKLGFESLAERIGTWERRQDRFEVIGNIYENPELLEKAA